MASFVRTFDCKNQEHVLWLKKLGETTAQSLSGEKADLIKVIADNPLPDKPSMDNVMEFAYIHFQLCMKYTNAVLSGDAFIPNTK